MELVDGCLDQLDSDQLVNYNPKLVDYTPVTRMAYAKFKTTLEQIREPDEKCVIVYTMIYLKQINVSLLFSERRQQPRR